MTYIPRAVRFGLYTLLSELPIAATHFSTNRLCVRAKHYAMVHVVRSRVRSPSRRKQNPRDTPLTILLAIPLILFFTFSDLITVYP
jgi:hypothetical protein